MSQWTALRVQTADYTEPRADGEVDRAVDLLVEQRVLRVALDARVAADAELAEPARALVGVERRDQRAPRSAVAVASTTVPPSKRSRTPSQIVPW